MIEGEGQHLTDQAVTTFDKRGPEELGGRALDAHALEVDARVEPGHLRGVDAAGEPSLEGGPRPRRALDERSAHEQDRGVTRKELSVVLEQAEAASRETPVRGERVDHVDLSALQGRVRERVLDRAH